ncbi:MAG: metalloregulator ArsR/SmtB family transcription factor [bacterium]|nr:metalloregulator ArsR/SmtB family transcription factor [bacterium]
MQNGKVDIEEIGLDQALDFFKALGNLQRLKIIGLLASRSAVVEEIAAALELSPATISHHLRVLRQVGLLDVDSDQQYRIYSLRERRLKQMSRELLRLDTLREGAGAFPEGAFESKVLSNFVKRGKLVTIPAQRKKREVILKWLVEHFKREQDYPESEVNRIIGRFHEDFCTLRRELIMARLLTRERNIYRRPA